MKEKMYTAHHKIERIINSSLNMSHLHVCTKMVNCFKTLFQKDPESEIIYKKLLINIRERSHEIY